MKLYGGKQSLRMFDLLGYVHEKNSMLSHVCESIRWCTVTCLQAHGYQHVVLHSCVLPITWSREAHARKPTRCHLHSDTSIHEPRDTGFTPPAFNFLARCTYDSVWIVYHSMVNNQELATEIFLIDSLYTKKIKNKK